MYNLTQANDGNSVVLTQACVVAGVFLVFGLSGIIPAVHYTVREGLEVSLSRAALGPLALMGGLYVLGAVFYAVRVPERWFPGKCDLWVQ